MAILKAIIIFFILEVIFNLQGYFLKVTSKDS